MFNTIAPRVLGAIEQFIGSGNQQFRVTTESDCRKIRRNDAKTGRHTDRPLAVVIRRGICNGSAQAFGEMDSTVKVGFRQDQHELFTAIANDAVDVIATCGLEYAGEMLQHDISGLMAVGVVD